VEGLVTAVFDDGIDLLYTVYYEDGKLPCELQFTAKLKSPARRLQLGDTITLILGPGRGFGPQQVVLYPPIAEPLSAK